MQQELDHDDNYHDNDYHYPTSNDNHDKEAHQRL
jgi:hypothetical protein